MNNVAEVLRINRKELEAGITGPSASWHEEFTASSWCYIGGLDIRLTEGDIICLMSEWGEVRKRHHIEMDYIEDNNMEGARRKEMSGGGGD